MKALHKDRDLISLYLSLYTSDSMQCHYKSKGHMVSLRCHHGFNMLGVLQILLISLVLLLASHTLLFELQAMKARG